MLQPLIIIVLDANDICDIRRVFVLNFLVQFYTFEFTICKSCFALILNIIYNLAAFETTKKKLLVVIIECYQKSVEDE